jgi:DNA-binding beta-propeller fold protein YncE
MKTTLIAALLALSALLPNAAQAKDCSILVSFAGGGREVIVSRSQTLIYNPINQENGGDTFFMSAEISTALTIQRESYLEDGYPTLAVIETATNKIIATSGPQLSPKPANVVVAFQYQNLDFKISCE